jgi:hypothetical protein
MISLLSIESDNNSSVDLSDEIEESIAISSSKTQIKESITLLSQLST